MVKNKDMSNGARKSEWINTEQIYKEKYSLPNPSREYINLSSEIEIFTKVAYTPGTKSQQIKEGSQSGVQIHFLITRQQKEKLSKLKPNSVHSAIPGTKLVS